MAQAGNDDYNPAEHPRTATDKAFRLVLYFKALHGIIEILGGVLLLVIKPAQITALIEKLTTGELNQDPNDFIATHLLKTVHHLSSASLIFGAIYLLAHGIVRLVLVVEIFRDHLWAYIGLIVVTALFMVYQIYRIIGKFSVGFLLLTIIDIIVIYLTQNEYRKHQVRLKKA
jgi:uncharacterized membrane protein